jgi:hypothetical protein
MKTKKFRYPELISILLVPVLAGAVWTSPFFKLDVHLEKGETEIYSAK